MGRAQLTFPGMTKTKGRPGLNRQLEFQYEHGKCEMPVRNAVWTAKAVLRGKFIAIQAYLKKLETVHTNNLTLRLQELEEQQQRQPRASRRKEITKIRAELNDID